MRYLSLVCLALCLVARSFFSYAQQQHYVIKGKMDGNVSGIVVPARTQNFHHEIYDTVVIDGGVFSFSGSTPAVSGAAAILRSYIRTLRAWEVKEILMQAAVHNNPKAL